ncbi:MAG: hypothetical protein U1F43_01275 [Myxococcota bacterium]
MSLASTSSPRPSAKFLSLLAGGVALASSSAYAAPPAPSYPPAAAPAQTAPPTVPIGVDFLPYAGTSSALPHARRVVSLNVVGGLAGGLDAFELGGAFNLHSGLVRGLEIAGALNVVDGPVHGGQLAGALNLATDELVGLQLGALDLAIGPVTGAQIGAVNIAGGDVRGAQIGTVNIADGDVHGTQIGVVNIAATADAGIGLVNVYWDGWAEADLAVSETSLALVGVRHGSSALYNVYYAGTRLDRPSELSVGFGIGGRWLLNRHLELSFDVTTISTAIDGRFSRLHAQVALRPQIAWRIADTFALWAGPTLNVLTTEYHDEDLGLPASAVRLSDRGADTQVWMWPGFAAGVRIF